MEKCKKLYVLFDEWSGGNYIISIIHVQQIVCICATTVKGRDVFSAVSVACAVQFSSVQFSSGNLRKTVEDGDVGKQY